MINYNIIQLYLENYVVKIMVLGNGQPHLFASAILRARKMT